ncbi:hypothetical protein BAZSYMB_SCAFFOLD00121_2 [Bathymodiolus azoricus thioautotrophic gill symbiont]|uniref:Uncharacterized protein n=1 Tax=Bathymodiolus azoricus thioautotrophic gill symbiont TaxID=235205 RepID=A0A1H6JS40_9GAMM|nr:hypothetical protein BAZSYMB_SCAFFOLD00121_2 [Bathymodiolus azoricus thioautotrophic gill symbiont]
MILRVINNNDRNYFFNLNDLELSKLKQFRIVQNKAHFILCGVILRQSRLR